MEKTYAILGYNGIPAEKYQAELGKLGLTERRSGKPLGLYLYFKGKGVIDNKTRSYCKTAIDGVDNICNKGNLRATLGDVGVKYMAREYKWGEITKFRQLTSDSVIIAKPVSGWGGKGIKIYKKDDRVDLISPSSYVFCEYVSDLLLFQGRKFHLRAYLFATTWGTFRVYPHYRIITAALPYVADNWTEEGVHDTHLKSTQADYFFQPGGDLYLEKSDQQIQEICAAIISHLQPKAYPESKVAYEMLGLDFLVKSNGDVVLLEVNTNAGIKCVEDWNSYKEGVLAMEMEIVKELVEKYGRPQRGR